MMREGSRAGRATPRPAGCGSRAAGHRLGRVELWSAWCVGALALIAAWAHPLWAARLQVHCPALVLAGIPCPTCGGTRALVAAVTGHWGDALAWNPAVGVLGILLLLLLPLGAAWLASGRPGPRIPRELSPATRWGAAVLLALHWAYLYVRFPG